jgi:hypothetical protein
MKNSRDNRMLVTILSGIVLGVLITFIAVKAGSPAPNRAASVWSDTVPVWDDSVELLPEPLPEPYSEEGWSLPKPLPTPSEVFERGL